MTDKPKLTREQRDAQRLAKARAAVEREQLRQTVARAKRDLRGALQRNNAAEAVDAAEAWHAATLQTEAADDVR